MRFIILFLILMIPDYVFATEIKDTNESSIKPISTTRYIAGGIIGTYPGFGLGHAVQGRWKSSGWIYTCGESFSMVLLGYGSLRYSVESINDDEDSDDNEINGWLLAGGIAYSCFKLAEFIDVWGFGYKYIQHDSNNSVYFLPQINTDKVSLKLCINF